jgi:hypothetical protein
MKPGNKVGASGKWVVGSKKRQGAGEELPLAICNLLCHLQLFGLTLSKLFLSVY